MTTATAAPDDRMPWDLLPSEVVCPACHFTYHRPLGACPTCKELRQ